MAVWVTSDWHFMHDKPFIYEPRGFSCVEDMNEALVERHNALVGKDDDVYVLGDLVMGMDFKKSIKYISKLNGRIHVVLGNHDSRAKIENVYGVCRNIVSVSHGELLEHDGAKFALSHFPMVTCNYDDAERTIEDWFSDKIGDSDTIVSSDLVPTMLKAFNKKTWNLCGHVHTNDRFKDIETGSFHVEVNANDCKPFLLDDIVKEMRDRYTELLCVELEKYGRRSTQFCSSPW